MAIVSVAAFGVAAAVLWLLLRSRVGGRLVAVPSDERWHERATPTFGGVGIFAGFVAGLADDLWHLSVLAKLGAQIVAAVIVIASGLSVEIVGNDVLAWGIGLL